MLTNTKQGKKARLGGDRAFKEFGIDVNSVEDVSLNICLAYNPFSSSKVW